MTKRERGKTAGQIADIIDRFVHGNSLYAQEWNDFVECSQPDPKFDSYRKRCDQLDPLVNSHAPQDENAVAELRTMIVELRRIEASN
jgi:hypothetical protein